MFGVSKIPLLSKRHGLRSFHLDFDTIDSVDNILANSALKPVWHDSVHKGTGELIYVDSNTAKEGKSSDWIENQPSLMRTENKKGKKFSPLPKRTKDGKKNGKVEPTGQQNGNISCKVTKEVVLKLSYNTQGDHGPLLQRLCGIVIGKVGVDIFGRTLHQNGHTNTSDGKEDNRVSVHALLPDGSAITTGDILIGDIITAINGIPVTLKSIDKVVSSLSSESQINLQLERPVSVLPNGSLNHRKVSPPNGKIIKLLTDKPDDVNTNNSFGDVPHAIMYLNMLRDSDKEDSKEILYKYPSKDAASKLHVIHGLYVTLGDMLLNITDSRITGTSLLVGEELVHVGYYKWCSELLVVALPAKNASQHQVQCIAQQIAKLMSFMFLSLNSAFCDEANHGRLNHLFNLLMFQLLSNREKVDQTSLGDPPHQEDIFLQMLPGVRWLNLPDQVKLDIDSTITDFEAADFADISVQHYNDRRPYVVIGSCLLYKGYLLANHLPTEDLLDISLYCNYYSLNGLATHQAVGQLVIWREVYPTRRVRPMEPPAHGYSEPQGRWFLLIVGLKHSVLCVLLEAGGCAFPVTGTVNPDPFYVDQLRATLQHLESLEVFAACEERLSVPPIPALSCVDWFFPSRKTSISDSGQPPLPPSASSSPMISRLHGQSPARGRKSNDMRPFHRPPSPSTGSNASSQKRNSVRTDSDNESEPTSPFPSRTNSTQSSPSLGKKSDLQRRGSDASGGSTGSNEIYRAGRRSRLVPDPYNLGVMQRVVQDSAMDNYSATKLTAGQDNTLFHFVHLDTASGIIVCPTNDDIRLLGGNIHAYLLHNFQVCCKEVRKVLQQYVKAKKREEGPCRSICRDDSLSTVQEYGVLFKCTPENWSDSKKQPPTIHYWVVGRLVKVASTIKELYVCHHYNACQNAVEMAFKLAYGAGL